MDFLKRNQIDEKKLKVAGQPKIDLKQFGEGKDLNYELQIDCLPSVTLKNFEKFKATSFKVKIEDKIIEEKLKEISDQNKQFEDKNANEKAKTLTYIVIPLVLSSESVIPCLTSTTVVSLLRADVKVEKELKFSFKDQWHCHDLCCNACNGGKPLSSMALRNVSRSAIAASQFFSKISEANFPHRALNPLPSESAEVSETPSGKLIARK